MFNWALNVPLPLDGYYLDDLSSLMYMLLSYSFSKMQFHDYNVVQDQSFKELLSQNCEIQNCFFFFDPNNFWPLCFRIPLLALE